jgi:plastocyanin
MDGRIWLVGTIMLVGAWATPAFTNDARVTIRSFRFRPDTQVVRVGAAVTWTNADDIEHTVSSDSAGSPPMLDGVMNGKRATYRAAFSKAGIYAYHCQRHQFMTGVIRVISPGEKP